MTPPLASSLPLLLLLLLPSASAQLCSRLRITGCPNYPEASPALTSNYLRDAENTCNDRPTYKDSSSNIILHYNPIHNGETTTSNAWFASTYGCGTNGASHAYLYFKTSGLIYEEVVTSRCTDGEDGGLFHNDGEFMCSHG